VGGFWGVLDADRRPKFPLSGPVSAEPRWLAGAGASAALALMPILWAAARRTSLRRRGWVVLAAAAAAAACSLVLACFEVAVSSLGLPDWALGVAGLAVAAASVALAGQGILAGAPTLPTPALSLIERVRRRRLRDMATMADALGWLRLATLFAIAATSLCLAFDGRYRDFPTATYAPPVACFLALGWLGRKRFTRAGCGREEAALGAIALAAAGAVVAFEGLGNSQALAWAGVTVAAAAIPLLELWPRRLQPNRAERREQERDGAELGVVEDEGSGAGGGGRQDGGSA
jgi:glucan 1,3-beta-glucosidase